MKFFRTKSIKNNRGAGFIEVLVALVILAIGLLGVLSMQARGLNSNQRALFATEVNLLAYDMADRIIAHDIAGAYDGLTSTAAFVGDAVAVIDQVAWAAAFTASSLPSADGVVAWNNDGDSATNDYVITIRWDDERTGAAGRVCPSDDRDANGNLTNLSCFQLEVNL